MHHEVGSEVGLAEVVRSVQYVVRSVKYVVRSSSFVFHSVFLCHAVTCTYIMPLKMYWPRFFFFSNN